jgi:hypothetical protein
MTAMRFLARWSVVLAFSVAVLVAAAQPAWEQGARSAAPGASSDAAGSSSGFTSTPAPERPTFIGPGGALQGSTVINAFVPSQSFAAWHLPNRATAVSSPALQAHRLSPHLRSIPLLI